MKNKLIFLLFSIILASCAVRSGIQGVDYPVQVESGKIQVVSAEKKDSFKSLNQTVYPRNGNVFLFLKIKVEGKVPLAGVDDQGTNLMNGAWKIIDINNNTYKASGLVDTYLVFELTLPATGLRLVLGPDIVIPLGSFFGEQPITENLPGIQVTNTPGVEISNDNWKVQVLDAYWTKDVGISIIKPGENEKILAITINLEYTGPEADVTVTKFLKAYDDSGRELSLQSDYILNNGSVPDGGKDWLSKSAFMEASRHFITGERFNSLVLFFIGQEDAKSFSLCIDNLPQIDLSGIIFMK
jgi:hypothetical protein